jgi:hypothetical protein
MTDRAPYLGIAPTIDTAALTTAKIAGLVVVANTVAPPSPTSCEPETKPTATVTSVKPEPVAIPRNSTALADGDDAEWERGFDENCDNARRERSREIIEAEIERLALLTPVEYEIERKAAAERLDMRPSVLDTLVKAKRPKKALTEPHDFLPHWTVEPWPSPVDGDALLGELREHFTRYCVLPKHAAVALALWVLHTWTFDCFDVTPYLVITSPTRRCGKSLVLTMLYWLCRRAKKNDTMSKAAIYRSVETEKPTLLLDEVSWIVDQKDERQGILCGGFERLGHAELVEGEGDSMAVRRFSTYCPKAYGIIGKLTATLMDRSIEIRMQRKRTNEAVERLPRRGRDNADYARFRQRCLRWADDNRAALSAIIPRVLDELNDRAFDVWEPLLAIAECVGGHWHKLAVEAAIALSGGEPETEEKSVELLGDIKAAFARSEWLAMPTKTLIAALCADEERPWATWNSGRSISDRQVARLLKQYAIVSETVHPHETGEAKAKGYRRARFEEAFERYLTAPNDSALNVQTLSSAHDMRAQACERANVDETGTSSVFSIRAENFTHGCEKREKPANDGHLHARRLKNPKNASEGQSDRLNGGNGAGEFHLTTPPCAQCRAGRPDDPPTVAVTGNNGMTVFVHDECLRFWKQDHGDPPAHRDGLNGGRS